MKYLRVRVFELAMIIALNCLALQSLAVTTIVGDGGNLVSAIASATNGDTIEIRSNQTFVGTLNWSGKFLTIQAGAGFSPTIKGDPYTSNSSNSQLGLEALRGTGTGAILKGLRFEPGQNAPVLAFPYNARKPFDFTAITNSSSSNVTFQEDVVAGAIDYEGLQGNSTMTNNHFLGVVGFGGSSVVTAERNRFDTALIFEGSFGSGSSLILKNNSFLSSSDPSVQQAGLIVGAQAVSPST